MSYQEVLDRCLTALEQGATIEECVRQYPDYRVELEHDLRLVQEVRRAPKPQMSAQTFAETRAALRARALLQQQTRAHRGAPGLPSAALHGQPSMLKPRRRRRYTLPKVYKSVHALTAVTAVLLVLLSVYTFARTTAYSLPGDALYGLKRGAEEVEGVLMRMADDSAAWHARQVERRLRESLALQANGEEVSPRIAQEVEEDLRTTLDASADLTPAERDELLHTWLVNLEVLQMAFAGTESTTLRMTIMP